MSSSPACLLPRIINTDCKAQIVLEKNTNKTESSTMHHNSLIGRPQNGKFAPKVNLSRNHIDVD